MSSKIESCRICEAQKLNVILELGSMELSGVFPDDKNQKITTGPLTLVKCTDCGLVQLDQSFPLDEMYGDNYGYRSGLNGSMVKHLGESVERILKQVKLNEGDYVLDIGSNDGTLLSFYPEKPAKLIGMDPTIKKFGEYYKPHITKVPDFFSKSTLVAKLGNIRAKVVTSFSMFYDLEKPMDFVNEVSSILADDGIWVFEQSYLPTMVERLSFDTVCHEHLEYYALKQIKFMLDRAKMKIVDVHFNDVNGGSFVITAALNASKLPEATAKVQQILKDEEDKGYNGLEVYKKFAHDVAHFRDQLNKLLADLNSQNKTVVALGASTKGNVLLQYCNLNPGSLKAVGEVNPFKFGKLTPKTHIPICSEEELEKIRPDYKLVLPWHFRDTFLKREAKFLEKGGKLIFPLPKIEIISN